MMDNDVNQRRVAVFQIIYVYSLNLYSRWVPRPLRWGFEILILLAALLTLCVWGYVHNTYIMNPTDCLKQITDRPFPPDVILQVEVYSNFSYLWEKRNVALKDFLSSRQQLKESFEALNETVGERLELVPQEAVESKPWAHYCNFSLLELLWIQSVCEVVVERIGEGLKDLRDEWFERAREVETDETEGLNENITKDDLEELNMNTTEDDLKEFNVNATGVSMEELNALGDEEATKGLNVNSTDSSEEVEGSEVNGNVDLDEFDLDEDWEDGDEVLQEQIERETEETDPLQSASGGENTGVSEDPSVVAHNVTESAENGKVVSEQLAEVPLGKVNEEELLEYLNSLTENTWTLYELLDFYTLKLLALDYTLLEFTRETGYLSLTSTARQRLNITVIKIYVDPDNTDCFGGRFGNFLTKYFLGYDMMIISSFKNLLPEKVGSGYVKDLLTGSHYYYKVQWMGKWRYLAGLLPAMFFTLVASVLLRQVHYHVFKFLTHFRNLLNQGIPMPVQTGAQIPFLIVTYAAIGLIIVMSEALSDDSMFSVLMVATVWEVDQFYAIYCRQQTSKMYFPWFFFLYHFLPYAYFVRFNGQFWFLPFLFHWLMTQHAMLFFINHCELPGNRIRIIFRMPHGHAHLPPIPGLQPNLHQPQVNVRFNVQIGPGQQPAGQHERVNVPGAQGVNIPNANVQQDAQQQGVNGAHGNQPQEARNQVEETTLRRRPVSTQGNGTALAQENNQTGASELVSGNSGTSLLPFSGTTRRHVGGDNPGEGVARLPIGAQRRSLRERVTVPGERVDLPREPLARDGESQGDLPRERGAQEDPPLERVGPANNMSRESIRAARLNRFERTGMDNTSADTNTQV